MKTIVFLMMVFPYLLFAQNNVEIRLNQSIQENAEKAKSLTILDLREDKNIGEINQKTQKYTFYLPQDLDAHFKEKFDKVKIKGKNDILILLEELKVYDKPAEKFNFGMGKIKLSSFLKKDGKYYLIDRLDKEFSINPREMPAVAKHLEGRFSYNFTSFIKKSYLANIIPIALDDYVGYENTIFSQLPIFTAESFQDGVYLDVRSFLLQKPEKGFEIIKNKNGKVTRIVKGEERLNLSKVFIYVEKGIPFKNTASGFMELLKDEKGFYVFSNKGYLAPTQMNSTYGMFGLIGGIAGAIEANAKNKQAQSEEKKNIYIDIFTGDFIFE